MRGLKRLFYCDHNYNRVILVQLLPSLRSWSLVKLLEKKSKNQPESRKSTIPSRAGGAS